MNQKEDGNSNYSWSVGDKRVMTTQVVGTAWTQFCCDKTGLIQKAFRDVGVTLPVDGSKDHELRIKGIVAEELATGLEDLSLSSSTTQSEDYHALPLEPVAESDPIVFTLRSDTEDLE